MEAICHPSVLTGEVVQNLVAAVRESDLTRVATIVEALSRMDK